MEPIHKQVGKNLAALRKTRGLSLDQVAELTGVSKAMLGQIERGDSNPTISVLWKIVNGLKVSFTSLLEKETHEVELISRSDIASLVDEDGYRSYPMFPYDPDKGFEIYYVEMDPGTHHPSEAHNSGITEYVMTIEGEVSVMIDGETYAVNDNQALRFSADRPHSYANPGNAANRHLVLIHYPR